MKKMILTALFMAAFASSALAAVTINGNTTIGSLTFTPSNSVFLNVSSTAAAYVSESLHKSGSRVFATDSKASIIWWKDANISSTSPTSSFTSSTAAPTSADGEFTPALVEGSGAGDWHKL